MNLWDKKAKNYARYNDELNQIQKNTFKELARLNIDFCGKKIIDIGCGTGVWTLHLAKMASEVMGVDSSKAMLEILQNDAKSLKLSNVKCENLSFDEWAKRHENSRFDIAFLSMSLALQSEKDYEIFINLAKTRIYLGWAKYRKSDFLEPIFKHFKAETKSLYKKDIENFLLKKKIPFHKFIFDEKRIAKRSKEEALENALWHLSANGVEAIKSDILSFVKGDIVETISSKIKLLIF